MVSLHLYMPFIILNWMIIFIQVAMTKNSNLLIMDINIKELLDIFSYMTNTIMSQLQHLVTQSSKDLITQYTMITSTFQQMQKESSLFHKDMFLKELLVLEHNLSVLKPLHFIWHLILLLMTISIQQALMNL